MTRVLVVDDKPENLYLLRVLLQGHGYMVDEARHGAEALVKARQARPDLIVSDLLLPVMDGYTLLRQWKADEGLRTIPFVVYTATYTDPKDERLALETGSDAFIVKPAEPEPFMARIREVLAQADRGELAPPRAPQGDEKLELEDYSETLVRKLEKKATQLEQANRELREDVARRERTEGALRECENERRLVLERVSDSFVALDRDWRYTYINAQGAALFGRRPEDLLGKHIWTEFPEGVGQPFHKAYERAMATQQPIFLEEFYEPWNRWFENRIYPSPEGLTIFYTDITERKQTEAALRDSEERLRLFVRYAPAAIAMFDTQMRYLAASDRWRTDYRLDHKVFIGRSHYEIFPGIPERWKRVHERVLAGGTECAEEDPFPRADGSVDWVRWEMLPWRTSGGAVGGALLFSEVITARVDLLERERRSRAVAETLAEANLALTHAADLETVLEALLDHLARLVPYDSANVMLLEEDGRRLAVRAARGYEGLTDASAARRMAFEVETNPLLEAILTARAPLVVRDSLEEPAWQRIAGAEHVRGWLGVPLVHGGQVLGLFSVDKTEPGFFTQEHARLAEVLAPAAATAIANAQLLAELRASQAKYRGLIEQAVDGIVLADAQGKIQLVNSAFCALVGYARDELLELNVADTSPPAERSAMAHRLATVQKHGSIRVERTMMRKDGSTFPVDVVVGLTASGSMQAIVRDITERRKRDESLRETEERIRTLVEHLQVGVLLQGRRAEILLSNPKALELLGLTEDQLLGKTSFDPEWDVIHEDGSPFPGPTHPAPQVIATSRPVRGVVMGVYRPATKDRVWLLVDAEPQLAVDGAVRQVICTFSDITERKRAEGEQARLWSVLEASLNEIYTFDPQTLRFLYVNDSARRNLGYSMETLRALTPVDVKPEFTDVTFDKLIGPLRRHEQLKIVFETIHRRSDASLYPVEVHLQLVERGGSAVFLAVINDITERKRAEEELRNLPRQLLAAQEKERQRIARELHDEIGQLLTAVKLNLQSLRRLPAAKSLGKGLAESVSLVDSGISEVRNLALALRPSMLDDLGLAAALRWFVDGQARAAAIEGKLAIEPGLPRLPGDLEVGCFRVVQEAVTNVLRHAQARWFSVEVRRHDGNLQVSVRDDGKGFDVAAARERARQGGSMGLLGMEERVLLLGGSVALTSTPGGGTEIRARFPLAGAKAPSGLAP